MSESTKLKWRGQCYARDVQGIALAQRICWRLLDASCWFAVEPLSEEKWLIAVKLEHRDALLAALAKEPT